MGPLPPDCLKFRLTANRSTADYELSAFYSLMPAAGSDWEPTADIGILRGRSAHIAAVQTRLGLMALGCPEEPFRFFPSALAVHREPPLAMTANAFAENKDQCFEVGMDDFISKPVMPKVLYETLLKWFEKGQG